MRADRKSGYYDRDKETMSAPARREYQARWLRELVDFSCERAPGMRRRLETAGLVAKDLYDPDALLRLPVLKKSQMPELQQADPPFGGFCTLPVSKLRRIFRSPGPIYEPMGPDAGGFRAETGYYAGGFRPGDVVLQTFAYHLVPAGLEIDESLQLIGCVVVPSGTGNTETQVEIATRLGTAGFVGTPSFLMTLLKRAEEMKVGRLPFEVAQVGAEALPESLRRTLEGDYGIMTRQGFGTADIGMVGYECPEKSGMHLLDEAIVQVCDPQTGVPLPSGQTGELVASVYNRVYPMIRFGTGDLTVVTDEPCPCGRTSARMLGWRGRADEVTKVRGMFIHPRQADEVVGRTGGVERYQVVVGREGHQDTLTLCVELGAGVAAESARTALEAAIRDVMKLRGGVDVVPGGTIPDNAKKIDDRRTWD